MSKTTFILPKLCDAADKEPTLKADDAGGKLTEAEEEGGTEGGKVGVRLVEGAGVRLVEGPEEEEGDRRIEKVYTQDQMDQIQQRERRVPARTAYQGGQPDVRERAQSA